MCSLPQYRSVCIDLSEQSVEEQWRFPQSLYFFLLLQPFLVSHRLILSSRAYYKLHMLGLTLIYICTLTKHVRRKLYITPSITYNNVPDLFLLHHTLSVATYIYLIYSSNRMIVVFICLARQQVCFVPEIAMLV